MTHLPVLHDVVDDGGVVTDHVVLTHTRHDARTNLTVKQPLTVTLDVTEVVSARLTHN